MYGLESRTVTHAFGRCCYPCVRNGAKLAEPEGFEPSIRLYDRITV